MIPEGMECNLQIKTDDQQHIIDPTMFTNKNPSMNASVQCNLANELKDSKLNFHLEDSYERGRLVRRMYGLVILQCHLYIPAIFLCRKYLPKLEGLMLVRLSLASLLLPLCLFAILHILRKYRRNCPFNYLAFALVTLASGLFECVCGMDGETPWVYLEQLVLAHGLLLVIAFTKLARKPLTQLYGTLIVLMVFGFYLGATSYVQPGMNKRWTVRMVLQGWYLLYDTKVMLHNGRYGHNIECNEYVYGATNLYADLPVLLWLSFKFFVLNGILEVVKFLKDAIKTPVC